ncbi:MAG: betaine/proline/choline family ABC transporter ATP-binding protein [Dehalococcoidia bacterium]|jgi:glycine betaine/proline transport system ATP-binding protein|nr:betaine/proline/choline family ABC transporter ATP-binding protein [Dehalococcoidia bacterium]
MASTPETVVSVNSLWKVYGDNPDFALSDEYVNTSKSDLQNNIGLVLALKDVSLEIYRGETFVVMGLSGSGKSTLVRCLNGLIDPTSGEIDILGRNLSDISDNELTQLRRSSIAMVFQHYALFPHLSVMENTAWGLEIQGVRRRDRNQRAQEKLNLVGLQGWEDSYPVELSGGMMQRVGLARALTLEPEILLMDEPFSGLDPLIRREMQDELLGLKESLRSEQNPTTIVFITHDLDEALKLGDRIAIMNGGEVVQLDTPDQIVLNPANEYVASFTEGVQSQTVLTAGDMAVSYGGTARPGNSPEEVLQVALANNCCSNVQITDDAQRFKGVVTVDIAIKALEAGAASVEEYVASPTTFNVGDTYNDVLPSVLAHPSCLPVVGENGELVGVIDSTSLASTWDPDASETPHELDPIVREGIEQILGKRSDGTES